MTGIRIGKDPSAEGWTYIECAKEPAFTARCVRTRGGRFLAVEPAGFPYRVLMRSKEPVEQPLLLRLMKAVSLSVERAASEPGVKKAPRIGWIRIALLPPADMRGAGISLRGERGKEELDVTVRVDGSWLKEHSGSPDELRSAVYGHARSFLASAGRGGGAARKAPSKKGRGRGRGGAAKVLFFSNLFMKDVDRGDALQVNPGIHYLVSPLVRKGVKVLLLDGKLPLQDVCDRPPEIGRPLAVKEFLTDPGELERALRGNPDLTMVCLTLLERCFDQVRHLCRFIRERSDAFIAIGGVFPTLTPEHAFIHLPEANFVVRGDGEEVLPTLVDITAGRKASDQAADGDLEALGSLEGVIARWGGAMVSCGLDRVNRVSDLDRSGLDFSFLEKKHVETGISMSTSRGCLYNCRFCSVMDKKVWRGKSAASVLGHLRDYRARLEALYGTKEKIPPEAARLQIWDDDFFIDPERAARLLSGMAALGFTVTFLQGTVSSFFRRKGLKVLDEIDADLLRSIPPEIFGGLGGLKIGTENFCDEELRRIGKPYRFDRIRKLALALCGRGISQEHYMILCNRGTTIENLMDNFEKIAEFRWLIGEGFKVLEPSWLMNLFPTSLYKACQMKDADGAQPVAGRAAAAGYGEYDYPFIIPERPEREEVYSIVRRFPKGMHFGVAGKVKDRFEGVFGPRDRDYLLILDQALTLLRRRAEELQGRDDPSSRAERFRIETCLERHFGRLRSVPSGLLRRVAPGLKEEPGGDAGVKILLPYVESIFAGERRGPVADLQVELAGSGDGVVLHASAGGVGLELLVQRRVEGAPCAFATKNLAFIVRQPGPASGAAGAEAGLIERVKALADSRDTWDLD